MLCQLVCVDRRYQRMNCFNIREIQALLKGRFFTELVNTHDHRDFLNKTTIGIRFKTNDLDSINPNMLLFYRYGVHSNTQIRTQSFFSNISHHENYEFFSTQSLFLKVVKYFNINLNTAIFRSVFNSYISILSTLNFIIWGHILWNVLQRFTFSVFKIVIVVIFAEFNVVVRINFMIALSLWVIFGVIIIYMINNRQDQWF